MSSIAAPAPSLRDDATLIGLVGLAHGASHFSQLLLPPLFPWLKDAFGVGYAELGLLLTVFFVVSCVVQGLAGFAVDRWGPQPLLFAGLGLLGLAALGFAASTSYAMLMGCVVVAGIGNGVFHPVDYSLINLKVAQPRLGHAYSVHGISGSLGWAAAPALLVPLALAFSWRVALVAAGVLVLAVLALVVLQRGALQVVRPPAVPGQRGETSLGFLRLPAVWACFAFFFIYACVLSVVQAFAPESARHLHAMPVALVAGCLTAYMLGAAGAMVLGGFLASDPQRSERVVAVGVGLALVCALVLGFAPLPAAAVPLLFGLMGACVGVSAPSRDLLVKRSSPARATGRVYGIVYSGLDIGQALAPLLFGVLMDLQRYTAVWVGLAVLQALLIACAFMVRRVGERA